MARIKEYDRDEVLRKAAQVFWSKGFEATSMSDLVDATKLNTASMYKEFGDKESLFEAVLDSVYDAQFVKALEPMRKHPGMESLRQYLEFAKRNASAPDFKGCIFLNNLAERNIAGDGVIERVEKLCVRLDELFEGCIRAAQKAGDIPRNKDARLLANFVLCFVHGLTLYGRVENHRKNVAALVDTVLATLER